MVNKLSSGGLVTGLSILALVLVTPLAAGAATQYFFDDFESYSLNSYPTSFTQIYNGSGDADQKVISTTGPDASSTQVFQLVGRSGWASEHIWLLPTTLPATLVIQAYIRPVSGQWPGRFGLRNPSGSWGTRVSAVLFDSSGNITALQNGSDSDKVQLGTYTMNTWYLVRMEHHLSARTYDVYIDGVQVGTDIPMHPTLDPTQLHLTAGNTGSNTIYFDDVGVYDADPTMSSPVVTTQAVTGIGTTTATGNGTITDLGSPNPTQHGVCWNTTGTPTIADSSTTEGAAAATGAFTSTMTGLSENTTYHVRAYATNSAGTAYGGEVSFTTLRSPGVTVGALSSSTTSEDGDSAQFTVVLDSSPSADVAIPLASSDSSEGTISTSSLTFTSANWDTAQTVTVTGVNDQLLDGDIVYTVEIGPTVSADPDYDGVDPADKTLTNIDNDVDTDNDGLSDEMEGDGDHDGDGIVDSQDYDPTGYLYDSATGKIVPGGRI